MELDYKAIGKRIKIARIKADMTQEMLAEKIELSPTHLSNIETGTTRVSLATIVSIANGLDSIIGKCHIKSTVFSKMNSVGTRHGCTGFYDCFACGFFVGVEPFKDYHSNKSFFRFRMGFRKFNILFISRNPFSKFLNGCGIFSVNHFFKSIFLAQVVCFQHIELSHFHIKIAFLDDERIAGCECFYLGIT